MTQWMRSGPRCCGIPRVPPRGSGGIPRPAGPRRSTSLDTAPTEAWSDEVLELSGETSMNESHPYDARLHRPRTVAASGRCSQHGVDTCDLPPRRLVQGSARALAVGMRARVGRVGGTWGDLAPAGGSLTVLITERLHTAAVVDVLTSCALSIGRELGTDQGPVSDHEVGRVRRRARHQGLQAGVLRVEGNYLRTLDPHQHTAWLVEGTPAHPCWEYLPHMAAYAELALVHGYPVESLRFETPDSEMNLDLAVVGADGGCSSWERSRPRPGRSQHWPKLSGLRLIPGSRPRESRGTAGCASRGVEACAPAVAAAGTVAVAGRSGSPDALRRLVRRRAEPRAGGTPTGAEPCGQPVLELVAHRPAADDVIPRRSVEGSS